VDVRVDAAPNVGGVRDHDSVRLLASGRSTNGGREKLEEKKIEIALEAMALAHECRFVFRNIRSPMSTRIEWVDIPKSPNETDESWNRRGPYYAILSRVTRNRDYFERLFKLQPKFMAMFGAETDATTTGSLARSPARPLMAAIHQAKKLPAAATIPQRQLVSKRLQ
jgi:hypothetical protein